MDNLRKHLFSSKQTTQGHTGKQLSSQTGKQSTQSGRSTFHTPLPQNSQSTFHAPLQTFQSDIQELKNSSQTYVKSLRSFCGAGTHFSNKLNQITKETKYNEIAGQFHDAMDEINSASNQVAADVNKKLDKLFNELVAKLEACKDDRSDENIQVLAQCFVTILQLQCQFFLSTAEVLSQFSSVRSVEDLLCHKQTIKTPSMPLVEDKQLNQSEITMHMNNESETIVQKVCVPNESMQKRVNIDAKMSPFTTGHASKAESQNLKAVCKKGVQLREKVAKQASDENAEEDTHEVSQEELDTVIDFLAGVRNKPSMQIIPEIKLPSASMETDIPQEGVSAVPNQDIRYPGQLMHRMSDPIQFSARDSNTWPSPDIAHHRSSYPTDLSVSQQQMYVPINSLEQVEYNQYGGSTGQVGQFGLGQGQGLWAMADTKLNRSWPMPKYADGWSAPYESSSDDSSNEEQLLALGSDLMNEVGNRRRHSSGDHKFAELTTLGVTSESRPRSADDLQMDYKSTNTWPPKQAWARPVSAEQVTGLASADLFIDQSQPPLQVNWGEQLVPRQQAPWSQGYPQPPPQYIRAQFTAVPPGGSTNAMPPTGHAKLDRRLALPVLPNTMKK